MILIVFALVAMPILAGPIEDADIAFDKEDFATAWRLVGLIKFAIQKSVISLDEEQPPRYVSGIS